MSFGSGSRSTPLERIPVVPGCRTHNEVKLYVYKIDKTSAPLGCSIVEGMSGRCVRHSAIVVFGCTYQFSQDGVEVDEETGERTPEEVISLGRTRMSVTELNSFVDDLRRTTFTPSTYSATSNNCHHFSNELSKFMTNTEIPATLLGMGNEVRNGALKTAAMGVGALAVGGLAYHLYTSAATERERERKLPRPQSDDDCRSDNMGLLGALAAGAAGLAACLESPAPQQTQRLALGSQWPTFGDGDDSSGADAAAELLKRLMNLGNK